MKDGASCVLLGYMGPDYVNSIFCSISMMRLMVIRTKLSYIRCVLICYGACDTLWKEKRSYKT
jgi:hypothetical protein